MGCSVVDVEWPAGALSCILGGFPSSEVSTVTIDGARVDAFGCTDVGRVRVRNQDHYLIATLHRTLEIESTSIPIEMTQNFGRGAQALLLLVADGVGGGAGGEEASTQTLDTIVRYVAGSSRFFGWLEERGLEDFRTSLTFAVQWSHAALRDRTTDMSPELAGMASTLTMALVIWPRAFVSQVGDSRCYHLRSPELTQVTTDQTVARQLIDQGLLPEEAAEQSPLSHVLSQAIGHREPDVWPVLSELELRAGDTLLLCTDGLMKHVPDAQIAELLSTTTSASEAASALVGAALQAGGSDNVTVVAARFQ
jgi:serine/threonine protein phosphatase PrpC